MTRAVASTRVLFVCPDEMLRDALGTALTGHGYHVHAQAGAAGIERVVHTFRPDIALVELHGRAHLDGIAIGRRLRSLADMAMIYLASGDCLEDRLAGFDAGADDVLAKPFATAELFARMRAVLRRNGLATGSSALVLDDLVVDDRAHTVERSGAAIQLTSTEFSLLSTLLKHRGQVLSKVQLLSEVWGFEHFGVNLVEVHMSSLRRKIEVFGPRLIHTVRGVGYVARPTESAPLSVVSPTFGLVAAAGE